MKLNLVKEISLAHDAISVADVPNTDKVFVGGIEGKVFQLDLAEQTPEPLAWSAHVSYVSGLVVAGNHLISGGSDHLMIWWDRETHRPLRIVHDHPKWIRHLALSPDQRLVASVCDDMVCRLFDAEKGKLVCELRGHSLRTSYQLPSKLYTSVFSHDGQHLATADQTGHIVVWDVCTGKQVAKLHAPHFFTHDTNGHGYGGIRTLAFSPDSRLLAAGGNRAGDTSTIGGSKSLIQVFDWRAAEKTHDFIDGGNFFYERLQFHHEGRWLVGGGGAGTEQKIAVFDVEKGTLLDAVASPLLVFDMALSKRSDSLVTVGRKEGKGHVALWQLVASQTSSDPAGPE